MKLRVWPAHQCGIAPSGASLDGVPAPRNRCGPSPIIIDPTGKGFHFTDPSKQCVLFDILGNGKPQCVSWPEEGSGDAWLVLPNEHGEVLNVDQVFGDHSPHPDRHSGPVPLFLNTR